MSYEQNLINLKNQLSNVNSKYTETHIMKSETDLIESETHMIESEIRLIDIVISRLLGIFKLKTIDDLEKYKLNKNDNVEKLSLAYDLADIFTKKDKDKDKKKPKKFLRKNSTFIRRR